MTDQLIERNIAALRNAGIDIKADQLFDLSVLGVEEQIRPIRRQGRQSCRT